MISALTLASSSRPSVSCVPSGFGSGSRSSSEPVSLHFTSMQRRTRGSSKTVTDAGDTCDPLEQVEVHAGVVRDRGLDRVGVRHDHDGLVRMVARRPPRARRPCAPASRPIDSPPGNRARDGATCTDLPHVGLGEVGDLAAGPLAVVGLDDARQRLHLEPVVLGDRAARSAWCARSGSRRRGDREHREPLARPPPPARDPCRTGRCPGMRPESSGPVCAVTAWRTSTSRVGLGGASAVLGVSVSGIGPIGGVGLRSR